MNVVKDEIENKCKVGYKWSDVDLWYILSSFSHGKTDNHHARCFNNRKVSPTTDARGCDYNFKKWYGFSNVANFKSENVMNINKIA